MHTHMYVCMYVCMYVYKCIFVYIQLSTIGQLSVHSLSRIA